MGELLEGSKPMTVTIIEEQRYRTFWVVGSGRDVSPIEVVHEVIAGCRPYSVNLVFIAQCRNRDLWLRTLVQIDWFLKPGHKLVGLPGDIIANVGPPTTIAEALSRRISEPIKADPAGDPVGFTHEIAIRNLMLDALRNVTKLQADPLRTADRF
jgi:hypothetical protein